METRPGERFQGRFRERRHAGQSAPRRLLTSGAGLLLMGAGAVMMVAPGPGVLVFLIGAALVAQDSLSTARALDWSEVRLRGIAGRARAAWRSAPRGVRVSLALALLVLSVAVVLVAYRLFRPG